MKIKNVQLFSDTQQKTKALELAESSLELPFFIEDNQFNPIRDMSETLIKAAEIVKGESGYNKTPVTSAKLHNYRSGITRMTDNFLAGIFSEILRIHGIEMFTKCWSEYINDYIMYAVPCNPYNVYELIKGGTINFKLTKIPDRERIVTLKVIGRWNNDLKESLPWCLPPESAGLSQDRKTYKLFKVHGQMSGQVAARFIKLGKRWVASTAMQAMLWCIASGVNPIRLLNFAGYWVTHREHQPKDFSAQNAITQEHEIDLINGGRVVGTTIAKPQFTAGFMFKFASLIKEITWFNDKGEPCEMISDEFLAFCNCFILEDFYMCGGLTWQEIPLSKNGLDYYQGFGLSNINPATVRELDDMRADVLIKAKEASKRRSRSTTTGNPLFDRELLESN